MGRGRGNKLDVRKTKASETEQRDPSSTRANVLIVFVSGIYLQVRHMQPRGFLFWLSFSSFFFHHISFCSCLFDFPFQFPHHHHVADHCPKPSSIMGYDMNKISKPYFGLQGGWLTFWITLACGADMTLYGYDQVGLFLKVDVIIDLFISNNSRVSSLASSSRPTSSVSTTLKVPPRPRSSVLLLLSTMLVARPARSWHTGSVRSSVVATRSSSVLRSCPLALCCSARPSAWAR